MFSIIIIMCCIQINITYRARHDTEVIKIYMFFDYSTSNQDQFVFYKQSKAPSEIGMSNFRAKINIKTWTRHCGLEGCRLVTVILGSTWHVKWCTITSRRGLYSLRTSNVIFSTCSYQLVIWNSHQLCNASRYLRFNKVYQISEHNGRLFCNNETMIEIVCPHVIFL